MAIDRSIDEAITFGHELKQFYQSPDGLQRGENDFAMPEVMNWATHFFMGRDIEWVKQAIRVDAAGEWRSKHPGQDPGGQPEEPGGEPPAPPPPPPPPPDNGGEVPPQTAGGGFVEPLASTTPRPRLWRGQMGFIPDRGPFMFPPPYNTRGIRITNATDGMVRPVGMAYWPQLNNSGSRREMLVLTACDDQLTIFAVEKSTGRVEKRETLPFNMTGESCYFSFTDPDLIYTCPSNGGTFSWYNLATRRQDVIAENVKQPHSSADGSVHSFTLDGGPAYWRDGNIKRLPLKGEYDECQIEKSGRWLLSKETFQRDRPRQDNCIWDLSTGRMNILRDEDGAVGHSDMGYGYVVGEEDQSQPGGIFRLWMFGEDGSVSDGRMTYHVGGWTGMTRYVSHCNARQGSPNFQQAVYSATHDSDLPRVNEIAVASLAPGVETCRVVAPNLTSLSASGGGDPYWRKTRANVAPDGGFYCFSGNMDGDRMDIFVGQL